MIGPPLPPSLSLSLLNSTAVQVSWEKPFTWSGVADIISYTIRIYNTKTKTWQNQTVLPLANTLVITKDGSIVQQCEEMVFEVSATNAVGEGQPSSISGGFPIGNVRACADLIRLVEI